MPIQWLHILTHPDVKDKSDCFHKLQYLYTVSDAFDLLENLDVLDAYKQEAKRIQERESRKNGGK